MKIKNLFIGLGMVCLAQATMAQGLEGIIVERYYQADASDAAHTSTEGYTNPLTAGAVTYRVYVDMAAGYKFVQMFGTSTKNLVFNTTTSFYNDENYDAQTGPSTSLLNVKKNTAMIDSWLTAGLTAAGKVGVPRDEDTDGSVANPHVNGILGNTLDACFGGGGTITGSSGTDGMLASSGTTAVSINTLGMGGSVLDALVAGNALGNITVSSGSLSALGGIVGATASNKVLIGQFTTTGVFSFNLNLQLLSPTGQSINYVYGAPGAGQQTHAGLTFNSGSVGASSVVIATANNTICSGTSVTFTAATSNVGSLPTYDWKVNSVSVGTSSTYTSSSLANGDEVSCIVTPGGCYTPTPSPATNSNSITMAVTVAPNAGTLSGTNTLCPGSNASTFTTDGNSGGLWSSNNNAVAIVNPFSGVVSPQAAGTAVITYTVTGTGGCASVSSTRSVTVGAITSITAPTGTQTLCPSASATFSSTTTGGTWTSGNTAIATINASTGAITAVSAGTATMTYTVTNATSGCTSTATRDITVVTSPNAGTLSGNQALCSNGVVTFTTNGNVGGAWTSSATGVATINATTGLITPISAGTATMTYTICSVTSTRDVTVTAAPNAGTLSGNQNLCFDGTVTFTSNGNAGGTWSSFNTAVATINASTGAITPVAPGSSTMTYTIIGTGGCSNASATRSVTVASRAGTLSGTQGICQGGSGVTFTTNGNTGGTWTSSSTAVATINASTGAITPVASGTTTMTYTVTATLSNPLTTCVSSATRTFTITPVPSAGTLSGNQALCSNGTVTFTSNGTAGGAWTSSANGVATIDGTTGAITPVSAGTATMTYTVGSGGCTPVTATRDVTVSNPSAYYSDNDGDTYGAGAAINACSSPGASYVTNNTDCNDASSSVNPVGTEVCGNSIDEDCSGTDLACTGASTISTGSTTVSVIGNYGTGAQSNVTVNLATGTNSIESPGIGNDKWFSFVAQNNAVRIALTGASGVADDNDLGLYNAPATSGVQLQPIATENDVHPGAEGAAADGGSEILYYGQLVTGQTYFICVRNNNGTSGSCGLSISYLRASQNDIAIYTNNTNTYSSTCSNFKVAFRSGAQSYTVNRWSTNSITGSPAHSFTIPSGTITQLGRIVPANLSGVAQPVYTSVNVTYNLPDAFGNLTQITANGTVLGTFTLNSENAVTVRAIDQCAAGFKSTTSAVTTDRSVCGASQYNWRFTQVLPSPSAFPVSVNGALGASRILALSSVQGIANGQKYDVKIRPLHLDGVTYSDFGATAACVKTIGAAGMVAENSNEVMHSSALSSIQVYPNPSNGQVLNISWPGVDGLVKVMVLDATGKEVMEKNWVAENGLLQTLSFNEKLSSGLYNIALINNNETQVVRFSVTK